MDKLPVDRDKLNKIFGGKDRFLAVFFNV